MSVATPDSKRKPVRPLNRWGTGSLSVLQIIFLTIIVIVINYLSLSHYARVDLSRTADYSLSSSTKRYLGSEAIKGRSHPVRWIMAYRRTSPFYERVRALAEEYRRLSDGKITLEIVDPLRSPDRMQEINAAYGLTLVRDLIVIDARNDQSAVSTEDANKVRTLNPHIKIIVADDMAVYSASEGKRKVSGFQAEDVLTARLVESIEGHPRKMALLSDKSRIDDADPRSPGKSLANILRFQNVEITPTQLSGLAHLPDDVAGVMIIAPKYDFSDSEIAVLENYWNKPRSAILVMIAGGQVPPRLRAFLRGNGVTARNDRVITRSKDAVVTRARGIFTDGINFTRDLANQSTELGGASSSLDVREGAEDLQNRKIFAMGVIRVLDGFWGETKFGNGDETFDEREDNPAPLYLAACVTRGAESDDRFAADTSRMIVVSNTDFLSPVNHSAENLDFLASSTNWLVGRESLAGIGSRDLGIYKLPLLDAQGESFLYSRVFRPDWRFCLELTPGLTAHALHCFHIPIGDRDRNELRTGNMAVAPGEF
jgi:ABC-2 type transport system permease protein